LQHHGSFIISIQEMYYHVQYKLRILTSNNNFFIVTNSGIKIQVTTINYMILIIIKMHYSKYRIIFISNELAIWDLHFMKRIFLLAFIFHRDHNLIGLID